METTHKPLPTAYSKNSFRYELLERTPLVALYRQSDAETGKLVAFEVCRVLRHDGRVIAGQAVPAAEFLPSTEQWGQQAWTLPTEARARARYAEQQALLAARLQPH